MDPMSGGDEWGMKQEIGVNQVDCEGVERKKVEENKKV